jgi:hypothetical protein
MTDGTGAKDDWRYRATLILFAAVAAAVVLWFQRHVEPFVTQTLIIGGTVSLWGLWKLGWSLFEEAGGDSGTDLTRRLLQKRGAVRALAFAAIIVSILHALTSSVYVRYAGASPGEEEFTVRVLNGDKVFMGPFDIGPGAVLGRPMFPSWRTRELVYEIESPRGYRTLTSTLSPWSAHKIDVPGSFDRKNLHVLRIVPGRVLYSELAIANHYVLLRAQEKATIPQTLGRAIVVTGVTDADLPDAGDHANDPRFRQQLNDYYMRDDVEGGDAIIAAMMRAPAQRLPSVELAGGDNVEIEIGESSDDGQSLSPLVNCRFKVPSSGQPHTVFVGPTERDCQ